jgi:hypothetical protein
MPRSTAARRSVPHAARRAIPLDDEPLTPADLKAIAQARAEFVRGDYCTAEELDANVARLRSKVGAKGHRTRSRR